MRGQDQQAYDRGSAMFSPDGRIYQVEYAHEAVAQGSASVAVRTADGVVLAVSKRLDPLLVEESVEKLHKVDDHVGIATTGHVADGRTLVERAREAAQVHRLNYEEPVGIDMLTKTVTDDIQEHTQTGGTRPYGVSLLIGGVENGTPQLFEADPSGNPTAWKARAVGKNGTTAQDHLEANYEADLDIDGGVALALGALRESGVDVSADTVDIATVTVETGRYEVLSGDEVAEYIEANDLGGDAAEDDEDDEE